MDTSEFDKQIRFFEKQAKEVFDSLEKKREDFEKSTLTFVSSWIQNRVKDALTREFPDRAKELGETGVKAVKADLKVAVDKLPDDAKVLFADNGRWPHRKEYKGTIEKYLYTTEFEKILTGFMRQLFGLAGGILDKYKLIEFKEHSEWGRSGTSVLYGYGISLPNQFEALIMEYSKLYNQYRELLEKVELTKTQKAQAEAKDIWDKT
jgi:hypothetical protein